MAKEPVFVQTLVSHDITERKRSEEAIRESEERFRSLFENSLDAIFLTIPDGRVLDANPAACAMFGRSKEEFIRLGRAALSANPQELAQAVEQRAHDGRVGREMTCYRKDGSKLNTEMSSVAFRNAVGDERSFLIFRDITERKRIEEALRESEERFRLFMNNSPTVAWIKDDQGRYVHFSKTYEERFGVRLKDWQGKSDAELWPEDAAKQFRDSDRTVLAGDCPIQVVQETLNPDGSRSYWLNSKFPFSDANGNRFVGGIGLDITERNKAEENLKALNETLEQRVAERTELAESRAKQLQALVSELTIAEQRERQRLAEILHDDLQQILVGAKIRCEVLCTNTSEGNKKAAEYIIKLINKSLQTSRTLTAELSPPMLQQGSLSGLLKWLALWMEETHGLTVETQIDPSLDPNKEDVVILLFQSVRELLFNIVKHAGVKSARVEMASDTENHLRITVTDYGIGFDPNVIWEMAKAAQGFGLFSIRERLELMCGRFQFKSSPGNGAVFSLTVPASTGPEEVEKRISKTIAKFDNEKTGDRNRILLVGGHTVSRRGLATMLNLHHDIEVIDEAANGEEAVKKAQKLQPDVILMDISIPKTDGIEATRIISSEFPHIRIIGLSMHDKQDQAERMIEAGASTYCTKDGPMDHLLYVIRGATEKGR